MFYQTTRIDCRRTLCYLLCIVTHCHISEQNKRDCLVDVVLSVCKHWRSRNSYIRVQFWSLQLTTVELVRRVLIVLVFQKCVQTFWDFNSILVLDVRRLREVSEEFVDYSYIWPGCNNRISAYKLLRIESIWTAELGFVFNVGIYKTW